MGKIILFLATLVVTVLAYAPVSAYASSTRDAINVTIDGESVIFEDVQPIIVNGKILVPVRAVFENMGFEVNMGEVQLFHWPEIYAPAAVLYNGYVEIKIEVGGNRIVSTSSGTRFSSVNSQIYNDRLFVPLRLVAEIANAHAEWDSSNRTAVITTSYNTGDDIEHAVMDVAFRYFETPFESRENPLRVITSMEALYGFVEELWDRPYSLSPALWITRIDNLNDYRIFPDEFLAGYTEDFFKHSTLVLYMTSTGMLSRSYHIETNGDIVITVPRCAHNIPRPPLRLPLLMAFEIYNSDMPTSFARVTRWFDNFLETCSTCFYRRYGIQVPREDWDYYGFIS